MQLRDSCIFLSKEYGIIKEITGYGCWESIKKEACQVDFTALLNDKKKKANENSQPFAKNVKAKTTNNKMPMRKSGRGK